MIRSKFGPPDWARDAIWYQIFPERFRNGSARNDPRPEDFLDEPIDGWRVTPWGMDWYALDRWERPFGDFWRTVFWRRYGGDLIGIREKLGYLQDLGINAIYLNPIFMAPSLHKYDASCLHHVDPSFGPDRAGDLKKLARARETEDPASWIWTEADLYFLEFLADAHSKGIRVILDGVFNHCGRRFFAFQDVLRFGRHSKYADWFRITKWNADGTFEYQGWFGHKMLPEFARTPQNLVPPVRKYIFEITSRWMDPNGDGDPSDGIDGWRLDVAFCVPLGFWRDWRKHVKRINPEAYLTAEIVGRADDYLRGDTFDAVMNYMWLFPTINFFAPHAKEFPASTLRKRLNALRRAYPRAALPVLQNLLDSHDVGRAASMLENLRERIENFGEYFEFSRAKNRPAFVTTRPGPDAWQALRQALLFQICFEGAPMLYYGTEVGMWGANDPCDRQPMFWDDIEYEDERHTPQGLSDPARRQVDQELLAFVRRAIGLRRQHAALRRGDFHWVRTANEWVAAFERRGMGERIRAYFNTSDAPASVPLARGWNDLWNGGSLARNPKVPARGWLLAIRGA
ncbi:MAG: glycoside hydrolase family 13 protein [Kiritimatiellae bacterium]|nr:glycoside hydrolase family 13 protein [Kiritimatiellia bacterium]MDW8459220.1 glycoside hydrolase family 13 protein [Verrucomicrobiota bacterium]